MTASRSAGWLPRSTGARRSRASRSSRNAVALAALRNMPSVDGPSRCRTASSSCGRGRRTGACLRSCLATAVARALPQLRLLAPRRGWEQKRVAGVKSPMPRARSCWGQAAPLRSRRREGWGPPGQAGLPGWAGAACRPPRRRLPGAGQRAACCSRSPPALAPGQRPGSAAEQRARAAPSSSCCCSLLLQRKREQEPVNADHQASAPGACPALPCPALPCPALPCLQRSAERCGRTGREPAAGATAPAQRLWLGGS